MSLLGLILGMRLISVDSSLVGLPVLISHNLRCFATVKHGAGGYEIDIRTPDTSWQLRLAPEKPVLDFALGDQGELAVMGNGKVVVYQTKAHSWHIDWPGRVIWLGPYLATVDPENISLYHGGFKPMGAYQLGLPADYTDGVLAGISGDQLVIYGRQKLVIPLQEQPVRFLALGQDMVAVAFPNSVECFDLRGNRLWDREFSFSTSALSFGRGFLWVAGSRPKRFEAQLLALDPATGKTVHSLDYKGETEPAFVSRIACEDDTLRVLVSKVLYTYEVEK